MKFAEPVSDPSVLDKTEQEEEQEEEEDEENSIKQDCRTPVKEDTEALGHSRQTEELNDTEHKGIKNTVSCTNILLSVVCVQLKMSMTSQH